MYRFQDKISLYNIETNIIMFIITFIDYLMIYIGITLFACIFMSTFKVKVWKLMLKSLILSSFGELLIIIMLIWNYHPKFLIIVKLFIAISRIVALKGNYVLIL